jgi:hypothetical protein
MIAVMGEMPGDQKRVPLEMRVENREELPNFTRQLITFNTEPKERIAAYLLIPKQPKVLSGKTPAMLCLHQTTQEQKNEPAGVSGSSNLYYAAHLAERGYVTLAPDYSYGQNFQKPGKVLFDPYANGYASASMKGIWNHKICLDLLQSMPQVNGKHIGVIGHSLGGHNSLFLAAFDERVKVVVSSCGFTRFSKYMNGNLEAWSHSGYMPRVKSTFSCDPAQMPFDFPAIIASLAPRAFFTNSPLNDSNFDTGGVRDCIDFARPFYEKLNAGEKLQAAYPDCGHDFPEESRTAAYEFVDRWI